MTRSLTQSIARAIALRIAVLTAVLMALGAAESRAAGTLSPKGSSDQPIRIVDHHVDVTLNNGFARTEVTQRFHNPNARVIEAMYSFPLPVSASLSEVTVWAGEKEIHGEVIERKQAQSVYEQERNAGNDAAIAQKDSFYAFDFAVAQVPANGDVRIQFVYYQPLEIDTGVGRYVYPLRGGGTDQAAMDFWSSNSKVENSFSINVDLKSAWPVTDVRTPGFADAIAQKQEEGRHTVQVRRQGGSLEQDFVLYYRLADNLPGRIEVIPYRADASKPGTFMMVVTPGIDLQPITRGADYTFVLDVSGSMAGKLPVLADGVTQSLGKMLPADRFRIITFSDRASDLTGGWQSATPENVAKACAAVKQLQTRSSTNLYEGLKLALSDLDDDRATSIVLVTDAVTNTGITDPREFGKLMQQYDVRVFGFVMGNSGNWPLMRTVCDTTGGFYAGVSNDDDIVGQVLLAKSKITHESLHDASLKIKGIEAEDVTDVFLGKVYKGQQLVLFGRYDKPGKATVTLNARLTGEDKAYSTTFDFPETATDNPEIERLWALNQIETIETKGNRGQMAQAEVETSIRDLGLNFQLVTDYTSMIVLADDAFERHGIARNNQQRVQTERQAQAVRSSKPIQNHRVDQNQPAFPSQAPSIGNGGGGNGGGGALDPIEAIIAIGLVGAAWAATRWGRNESRS